MTPYRPVAIFGFLSVALLSTHAHAANRCVSADGKVTYQDAPCSGAATQAPVQIHDNTVRGMSPVERWQSRRSAAHAGATAEDTIRNKCAADWPSNHRMRTYCEERQAAGLRALDAAIPTASPEAAATIRLRCAKDWPNDYRMRVVCQQRSVERLGQGIP